ncbi:hypothetical protein CW748_14440 [Alteromonadales bacterium alter-6D02]|nr:hypothetical protein CW748_14440 [Alteromonadales bacterium alter-6D02]
MGGAHPVRFIDFGDGFVAGIPYGKAINPITKSNWEWVGVTPDIETSTDNAFETAYHAALNKLLNVTRDKYHRADIQNELNALSPRLTQ